MREIQRCQKNSVWGKALTNHMQRFQAPSSQFLRRPQNSVFSLFSDNEVLTKSHRPIGAKLSLRRLLSFAAWHCDLKTTLFTMSSAATTRSVLRQSRLFFRQQYQRQSVRQASTTEQTAQKAKETAQQVKESTSSTVSKAQQGLSRVTSSAGPAISNAASSAGNALRRVGGRTGRLISCVDCTNLTPRSWYR